MANGAQISPLSRRAWVVALVWGALFLAALFVDRPVAQRVHDHPPFDKHSDLAWVVKLPGDYRFTIGIAVLLAIFYRRGIRELQRDLLLARNGIAVLLAIFPRRGIRAAVLPLIAGALGGLLYLLIKWMVGRQRPVIAIAPFRFHPFFHGLVGLFKEPGLSFPSGHTCLSFATAWSLTMLVPRWRVLWYLIALLVAGERVLENAHYVSDVVAGAALGTLCALVSAAMLRDGSRAS